MSELDELREYKARMEANPYTEMYLGLKNQWDNIARDFQTEKISISGDDKAFDRFTKMVEKLSVMTDNIERLRKKIGLEDGGKQETTGKKNPIENAAR